MKKKLLKTMLFGISVFALNITKAQIVDFNGAFPPTTPILVTDPVGTGATDEGVTKWYRGDDAIVNNPAAANSGINPGAGGVGFAASFNTWDIASGGKADLIFNDVDLSVYSHAVLRFKMLNISGTDVIRVFARNGNNAYTQVGNATYGVYGVWTEITISLLAFSGTGNNQVDVRFEGTSDYGADNIGLDDVTFAQAGPLIYGASSATHTNLGVAFKGVTKQEILRIEISNNGFVGSLVPSAFYFNTSGTTAASDLAGARMYATGASGVFSKNNPVGNVVVNPNGTFAITGITGSMAAGSNYFWLAYDVSPTATNGNVVDARFDSVLVGSTMRYPTAGNPAGNRQIQNAVSVTTSSTPSPGTSTGGRAPITSQQFHRAINLYPASELANVPAGSQISTLGFVIGAAPATMLPVTGTMTLYIENTTDAFFLKSTTWATTITGMTQVFTGTYTINPLVGGYDIFLNTPFTYTGGNLYVAWDWQITNPNPVSTASGQAATYNCSAASVGGNGHRSAASATAAPATLTASSAFRGLLRLGIAAAANDAAVDIVYTLPNITNTANNGHQVSAFVKNNGFLSLNNYPVNLNISGSTSFTNTQNVSLDFGESTIVTFSGSNATIGTDTARVSVANDDVNTNNAKSQVRTVNN